MAKITIPNITAGYASVAALNENFQAIEDALNNEVLYRDNPIGEANHMSSDLDMNGKRILNAIASSGEGFQWLGPWTTATSYQVNGLVSSSGSTYICLVSHTSGTFGADLATGKWELLAAQGASGAGTGDMLKSENLSGLASNATARANLGAAQLGANSDITSLASPALGEATAITQAANDNSTKVATTAYADRLKIDTIISFGTTYTVSGTPSEIEFTGIPATARRITILAHTLSTTGNPGYGLQLGTSASYLTTGYQYSIGYWNAGYNPTNTMFKFVPTTVTAPERWDYVITLSLQDASSNTWFYTLNSQLQDQSVPYHGTGFITLSEKLIRLKILFESANAFDSGVVNITWE